MKETPDVRLPIRRALFLTCTPPLLVSALVTFVSVVASGPRPPPNLQDNSPPYVSLDPDRLDFDDQVLRRWGRAKRIVVTNTGGQTLYVNSVTVGGDDERHFSIVNDTCTGAEVVPYRSCVIDINFGPFHTESYEAELKMSDNAIGSPRTLRLEGSGINSINIPPSDED